MPRTGTPFPRVDRRCQARTVVVALVASLRDPPTFDSDAFEATSPGWCPVCGTYFDVGTWIQYVRYGPQRVDGGRLRAPGHATCPPYEAIIEQLREPADQRLLTHVAPEARRRADCGHDARGRLVFLSHATVRRAFDGVGDWICERCATK